MHDELAVEVAWSAGGVPNRVLLRKKGSNLRPRKLLAGQIVPPIEPPGTLVLFDGRGFAARTELAGWLPGAEKLDAWGFRTLQNTPFSKQNKHGKQKFKKIST